MSGFHSAAAYKAFEHAINGYEREMNMSHISKYRKTRYATLVATGSLCLVWGLSGIVKGGLDAERIAPGAAPDRETYTRVLTDVEAQALVGGTSVYTELPNGNTSPHDNFLVQADVFTGYEEDHIYITSYGDMNKTGVHKVPLLQIYDPQGTAQRESIDYQTRIPSWPLGEPADLSWKVCKPNTVDCSVDVYDPLGLSLRYQHRIDQNVEVYKVKFHNLADGADVANGDLDSAPLYTDNPSAVNYAISPSGNPGPLTTDRILAQCSLQNRIQLRIESADTVNVQSGCGRFLNTGSGVGNPWRCKGNQNTSAPAYLHNLARSLEPGNSSQDAHYVHVFFTNEISHSVFGINYAAGFAPNYYTSDGSGKRALWMVVRGGMGMKKTVRVITHELAHLSGLADVNDATNCTFAGNNVNNRNVMCSPGAGSIFTSGNCSVLRNSFGLGWIKDWN
ncbi:MAG: hypothetical protein AAGI44_17705 [Pseudomonadota bacterium]